MPLALGNKGFVGVGDESSWGTAVSADAYLMTVLPGESLSLVRDYEFKSLLDGSSQRSEPYLKQIGVTGSLPMILNFEGIEWFMYQLLGSETKTTPYAGVAQYVWTPANSLPAGLTIRVSRDVREWVYAGCKIKSASFEFKSGEPGQATFDIIGKDASTGNVPTPTFKPYKPVLYTMGTIKIDGSDRSAYVKSASVSVAHELSEERPATSAYMIEPQFTDKTKVNGKLTTWVDSTIQTALYDKFTGGNDVALILLYEGAVIASTYKYTLQIECPKIRLTGANDPNIKGAGLIETEWSFDAYYDGTNPQIKITVINTNTTGR
jgi:hypothetical protein